MSIRSYVQRDVRRIGPNESAREAAQRMTQENVGCLIVEERGHVTGLLTDRDVALEILCNRLDPSAVPVRQLVRQPLVTLDEDASIREAVDLIRLHGIRRLPVVGAAGDLVGIVTADDLTMLFVSQLDNISDAVQRQLPHGAGG